MYRVLELFIQAVRESVLLLGLFEYLSVLILFLTRGNVATIVLFVKSAHIAG